jgi:hypothetical protein
VNDPGKRGVLAGQAFEETQQSPRCDPVALNGNHGPGQRPTRLEPLGDVGLRTLIGGPVFVGQDPEAASC